MSRPTQELSVAPVDGVGETATIIGRRANPCEFCFPRGDTCAVRTLRTEQRVNASASSDRGSVRRAPVLTFQETPPGNGRSDGRIEVPLEPANSERNTADPNAFGLRVRSESLRRV